MYAGYGYVSELIYSCQRIRRLRLRRPHHR
jgi:hypothetical protein